LSQYSSGGPSGLSLIVLYIRHCQRRLRDRDLAARTPDPGRPRHRRRPRGCEDYRRRL